jgi:hypothetical protein
VKYRRLSCDCDPHASELPDPVEAERFTLDRPPAGVVVGKDGGHYVSDGRDEFRPIGVGDYVVTEVSGRRYPMWGDTFERNYGRVAAGKLLATAIDDDPAKPIIERYFDDPQAAQDWCSDRVAEGYSVSLVWLTPVFPIHPCGGTS